jgi:hypothetical protein
MDKRFSGLRKPRVMSIHLNWSFSRRARAALAVVAMIWLGASAVHAQSLPPDQIARALEDGGYQLTGPIVRHGRVYFADVIGPEDNSLRLVIDARSGRLLQRYPSARRQALPEESSPLTTFFDRLFGRDEVAPLSPPPASDFYETPKPKALARRPKPEPGPVAQPATAPSDNKTASPTPAAPGAATPAAAAATAPGTPAPAAAEAKPAPQPAPATAAVAPSASAPKTVSPKVNDVPAAPLE